MSYVEIFVAHKDGTLESFDTASNNHGFAPLIWNWMAKRFNVKPFDMFSLSAMQEVWNLFYKKDALERWERVLLGMTFDAMYVPVELLPEAAEALIKFYEVAGSGFVRTTVIMATILIEAKEENPDMLGFAFNGCSAVYPFWYMRTKETDRPWNILTDKVHEFGEYKGESPRNLVTELLVEIEAYSPAAFVPRE